MAVKRSKRRKKIKFKRISIKVSANQYNALQQYCTKHKLTSNKVIKKALRVYLERFGPVIDNQTYRISENQLSIFDVVADELVQNQKK